MAYRSTISNSTGFTSYRLSFGREMRLGVDYGEHFPEQPQFEDFASSLAENLENAFEQARETLEARHKTSKEKFDKDCVEKFSEWGT